MESGFLIITLAMNGYQFAYRNFIATHKAYAKRLNAKHIQISRPYFSVLGVECCWLKLHLLNKALKSGYEQVLILDADTWIKDATPDIRINRRAGKYIYMANGYTNRFNSGVLWVRNHPEAIAFFEQVINHRLETVPSEDEVGWGENGHIIHHAKQSNIVAELDTKWNNTFNTELDDYIRHYNHGPFRSRWYKRVLHKILARSSRAWLLLAKCCTGGKTKAIPSTWFNSEVNKIVQHYPEIVAQRLNPSSVVSKGPFKVITSSSVLNKKPQ